MQSFGDFPTEIEGHVKAEIRKEILVLAGFVSFVLNPCRTDQYLNNPSHIEGLDLYGQRSSRPGDMLFDCVIYGSRLRSERYDAKSAHRPPGGTSPPELNHSAVGCETHRSRKAGLLNKTTKI